MAHAVGSAGARKRADRPSWITALLKGLLTGLRGWLSVQDLDWEEEGDKDDRNEANKHFEYYMMALVEGPKVWALA